MSFNRKVRLVQAFYGAIALTLMMQPLNMLGYGGYLWRLFMSILLSICHVRKDLFLYCNLYI